MSSHAPGSSPASSATLPNSSPTAASLPRLGPSWAYRAASSGSSHKGAFQPPGPQIEGKDAAPPPSSSNSQRSLSSQVSPNNARYNATNSFSLLGGDDEDDPPADNHRQHMREKESSRGSSIRSDGTFPSTGSSKPLFQRSSSTGLRSTGGKSLAELAANAPPAMSRSSSIGVGGATLRRTDSRDGGRSYPSSSAPPVEDPEHPTTRYTREKLLAMRPSPCSTVPDSLTSFLGMAVVSETAQDPVSFDEFDADEIWASARSGPRGSIGAAAGPRGGSVLSTASTGGLPEGGGPRRSSGGPYVNGGEGGRWQRGVALPPPGEERRTRSRDYDTEANNPEELWDDPLALSSEPASDFSKFGVSLDSLSDAKKPAPDGTISDAFDLGHMSEAALQFEAELHGANGEGEEKKVRPLAALGTTIRSGCGDDVNVFEDPDAPYPESVPAPSLEPEKSESPEPEAEVESPAPIEPEANDPPENSFNIPPVGGTAVDVSEEEAASSRLMKMIGVGIPGLDSDPSAAPSIISGWDSSGPFSKDLPTSSASAFSIPKNPWGGPAQPVAAHDAEWKLMQELKIQRQKEEEAVAAAARALEEQKQRKLQEEALRQQQAAAAAQQQRPQQQPSQVEMVLMERVSSILENSWGKADLGSILAALHRDDARVIPLLGNVDALRALLIRHPSRIQVGRDPAFGIDIAVLLLTNAQFVQQQQEQQRQQQQQEELERQHRQILQARQAAAAAAEAQQGASQRAALEMERARDQQLQMRPAVPKVRNAPWYYSDPQGNIQGPFGGEEMRQWLEGGYFKDDLPISQDPSGPFHALSLYFDDFTTAFQAPRESFIPVRDSDPMIGSLGNQSQQRNLLETLKATTVEDNNETEETNESPEDETELDEELEEEENEKANKESAALGAAASLMAGTSMPSDQNASSVQLKMLLGLSGGQSKEQQGMSSAKSDEPFESTSKSQSSKTKQKSAKQAKSAKAKSATQSTVSEIVSSPGADPVPELAPVPAPVAWGGAAQAAKGPRKKTMSEIQQEEARAAARMAREQQAHANLSRSGSNGWASVAATGTTAWSNSAVKPTTAASAAVSGAKPGKANTVVGATNSMQGIKAKQQAQVSAAKKQLLTQKQRDANGRAGSTAMENFGANMSPSMEAWCKDQLRQITGSDDLTLAAFCMTLNDEAEIKQYLTTYLGTSNQVNSFANEFVMRKSGGRGNKDEWETTGKVKGKKGKKGAAGK